MNKGFAASLMAAAVAAVEAENIQSDHWSPNGTYDHSDSQHHHYGGSQAASPAYPMVPNFGTAIDVFDTHGTLFGEHRYQLQVMKTGNMLIGTEALRESIGALRDRISHVRHHVNLNDHDIDENDSDIEDNRKQIIENKNRLVALDGKIHDLENGYHDLHHKLAIDREVIIMMCHQYAYASTIPDECVPIIGGLAQPVPYQWHWPDADCPGMPALPPFDRPLPVYTKETTDDEHHHHHHHDHAHPPAPGAGW